MSVHEEVTVPNEALSQHTQNPIEDPVHTEVMLPDVTSRRGLFSQTIGRTAIATSKAVLGELHDELATTQASKGSEDTASEDISRRRFLGLMSRASTVVGCAALGAYGLETAKTINQAWQLVGNYESQILPENKPTFQFLGNEKYNGQKQIAIYLPGFGDMHSKEEAELWHKTSNVPNLLTGYVDYSNEGTDIETIVRLIREQIDPDQVESITLVCRSIGGLFALPVAAELGIPVKSLLLMASPSHIENGDMGNFGSVLAKLPRRRWLATLGKLIAGTYRSYDSNGFEPEKNIEDGLQSTFTGANAEGLQTLLLTADGIDIQKLSFIKSLRKVFKPGFSRVAYTATNHPGTDQTVHVTNSGHDFQRVFQELGIDCELLGMPYDGHANVAVTVSEMRPWTQEATAPSRVPISNTSN